MQGLEAHHTPLHLPGVSCVVRPDCQQHPAAQKVHPTQPSTSQANPVGVWSTHRSRHRALG